MEEIKEQNKEERNKRWAYILLTIIAYIIIGFIGFVIYGVKNVLAISGHTLQIPSTNELYMYDCSSTTNCDGRSIPLQTTSEGLIETTQNLTVTQGETIDIYLVLNETLINSNYYTINHYITLIGSGGVINTQYLIESVNKVSLVNRTSNWYTTITNGGTSTTIETDYYQYYTYVTIASFQADRNTNYLHSQIKFNQSGTYRLQYNGYILSYSGFVGMTQQNLQQTVTNVVQQENATQTQAITENQNENTENMIDSQKVCNQIDKNNIKTDNYFLNSSGSEYGSNFYGITDYINIFGAQVKVLSNFTTQASSYTCFYDVNKTLISCTRNDILGTNTNVSIPNNTYYMRASIHKNENKPSFEICNNGNQAMNQSLQDIKDQFNTNPWEHVLADTEDYDDYEEAEDTLHTYTDVDLEDVEVEIDSDTNSWIWNTITTLINTNGQVLTLFISVLSIGVFKLILGR